MNFGQAELNKVVSENGPVESGSSVDGNNANEISTADNQKHHSLLLQVNFAAQGFFFWLFPRGFSYF